MFLRLEHLSTPSALSSRTRRFACCVNRVCEYRLDPMRSQDAQAMVDGPGTAYLIAGARLLWVGK